MTPLLPHEIELIESGRCTVEQLVAQYRVLFSTCWDVMTPEQQTDTHNVLEAAGLLPSATEEDSDG